MKLREATIEDSREISLLMTTLSEKYIAPNCTAEGIVFLLNSMNEESIKRYFLEGYCYYLAEDNNAVVGVIGMKNNSEIYHLFIAESYQGRGISRRLWELAKNNCLLKGNKGFFTVQSAINAKGLYLKLGFLQTNDITINSGIKEIPMELYC